jgi:hypothetical protein
MKQLVIGNLPQAYEIINGMHLSVGRESDYRQLHLDLSSFGLILNA